MPRLELPPDGPEPALRIQRHFPQIYLACHVEHRRRRSSRESLSAQDSAYLAHLDREHGTRPAALARHLGIGDSTLSAFIKRAHALGYLERIVSPGDRRQVELRLTAKGEAAMQASSVLDTARLREVLATLRRAEVEQAVRGLRILAEACRRARLASHPSEIGSNE